MKKILTTLLPAYFCFMTAFAQDNALPYAQIPDYPEEYTAETAVARLIDGLGFRYYWATEGLTEKDLEYRPSDMARNSGETLDHIYGLSNTIANAALKKPNVRKKEDLTFEEKRRRTLNNIKTASDILKSGNDKLSDLPVIFSRGEQTSEYPYWNLINGPIADAIWHVGQIVTFRRSSGNPMNSKVSVFNGRLRE